MRVRILSEVAAAKLVNFRLLQPTHPAIHYDSRAISVRSEVGPTGLSEEPDSAMQNWSVVHTTSTRYELQTEFGCVRVKQFLYDWGPCSALDHTALYDYRPGDMRAWPIDELRIAWTGWDYQRKSALSMLAWNTNLEIRELVGQHSKRFLVQLAKSFEPVDTDESEPLAVRSYWSRWPRYDLNMIGVPGYRIPSSLWQWRWPWLNVEHQWYSGLPGPGVRTALALSPDRFGPTWQVDSTCVFGDPANPDELQLLCCPSNGLGHAQLWFRQFARLPGSIREPAADEHPLVEINVGQRFVRQIRLVTLTGIRAFCASRTPDYGPHDIVWWQGHHGFLLQISAAVQHDVAYAIGLFSQLIGETVVADSG